MLLMKELIMKYKIVDRMNKDLKAMKGSFIGTLLAGLAGSILTQFYCPETV